MIGTLEAIKSLRPEALLVINGTEIEWVSTDIPQPTDVEIQAEILRLQDNYDSKQYARDRATEYSALNQFEMQFDDQQNNTTTWVDAINNIKARHPKS